MSSDEQARRTARPPAALEHDDGRDIAAAVARAKSHASPGRYGPPAATAKIDKFDLAQALALTTADGEVIPSSSKPPRDDDAPFVPGEVEVVGEEEVTSGLPSMPPSGGKVKSKPPLDNVIENVPTAFAARADDSSGIVPKPSSGNIVLVILGLLIGAVVIAYAYVTTR